MITATSRAPFLNVNSFSVDAAQQQPALSVTPARSPFLSVYELADGESPAYGDPLRESYALLMNQLHDDEFDEALFELQCRARAMHDEQLAMGKPRAEADRLVMQHYAPLIRESELMVDSMAREFAPREQAGIVDREIDSFVEAYAPSNALDPEFENFFQSFIGKVGGFLKKAAGKAWQGIRKVGLAPLLRLVKKAASSILKRVVEVALGKIPPDLRPVAQRLAHKLGFGTAKPAQTGPGASSSEPAVPADSVGSPVQAAAGDGAASPQQELNQHLAAALLAQNEVELELEAAQFSSPSGTSARPVFAELDDARERLIDELEALAPDQSAAPQIQNFLPALLPALRIAMRLTGSREGVVKLLAQPLAGLISKLVGPQQSPALARAIASAGLGLMGLEMSEAETARLAPSAVAATIEETISRVVSLPDEVLDNQELLEGYALEAFEHAAAANLPAVLSEATYRRRPDLLEAGVNAGWVLLPLRGPKRYKRCTRSFQVSVSPHLAEEVESFDGALLAEHLQDQLGLDEAEQVDGQLHLYEALPGTTLVDIARGESETLGPGVPDAANAALLHPLTPQAAAALLGKPGLGRALPAGPTWGAWGAWGPWGRRLAAGQRLYHLALGRRPLLVSGYPRRLRPRRLLRVQLTLDDVQDQVRVCVYLSEARAQKLAASLRQASNLGLISAAFQHAAGRRLSRIMRGLAPHRLQVVHAAMRPGQSLASALQNLPPNATETFVAKLQAWLVQAFAEFIKSQAQRLIAAAEDATQDGITLVFTLDHPPGLKALGQALVDRAAAGSAIADAINTGTAPSVRVDVFAGHRCG